MIKNIFEPVFFCASYFFFSDGLDYRSVDIWLKHLANLGSIIVLL